jgi:transcriptional regulator with XRE-family HTH domain
MQYDLRVKILGMVRRDPAKQAQAERTGRLMEEARKRRAASLGFEPAAGDRRPDYGPYSRAALAQRLRVSEDTIRLWELGKASPPKKGTIRSRLCRELGVTATDLEFDKLDDRSELQLFPE